MEGNENRTAQGDESIVTQGDKNQSIRGNHNTINIETHPGRSSFPKKALRDKNQQELLDYVDKQEVQKRLEDSLHNRIYIVSNKVQDASQVQPLCGVEVKIGNQPSFSLPSHTTIDEVFYHRDTGGKLLILGAPGAGKTTMLLKLAETLVQQAKNDPKKPIPVLLNLSSWKEDDLSLKEWIIAELNEKYGVSWNFAKKLLKNPTILPLLDGLDELAPLRQSKCVAKINEFLRWFVLGKRSMNFTPQSSNSMVPLSSNPSLRNKFKITSSKRNQERNFGTVLRMIPIS